MDKKRVSKRQTHRALHIGSGLIIIQRPYNLLAMAIVCTRLIMRRHNSPILALTSTLPVVTDSYLVPANMQQPGREGQR
jgi:hypothetical protein